MFGIPGEGFFSANHFGHVPELSVIASFALWKGDFPGSPFEISTVCREGKGKFGRFERLDANGPLGANHGELPSRPTEGIAMITADGGESTLIAEGRQLIVFERIFLCFQMNAVDLFWFS